MSAIAESLIAGEWIQTRDVAAEVRSPFSGEVVATVPIATLDDVGTAIAAAETGAREMAALPAYRRAEILVAAADLIDADVDELARTITAEQGKTTSEAAAEASRIGTILRLCAGEAQRLYGEVLPMDATREGEGRFGFTLREPCGVVVAISPFNYPAILVAHKIAPALAAGNAVVLKPASATPLTSLFIVRRLMLAGLPPLALQCLIGPGGSVGSALCADRRVRKISFTGSKEVGDAIARAAGLKRFTCELGSNTAVIILEDADIDLAAAALSRSPFVNAGQNCVSPQRLLVAKPLLDEFVDKLIDGVDELRAGDPSDPSTTLAPVISEAEAERVTLWVNEAKDQGAQVLRGGTRDRALVQPAVILDPPRNAHVWRDEIFGPAVTIRAADGDVEGLALANDSRFGLSFGVYTKDIERALYFARGVKTGLVHINSPAGTTWRADVMPWGGVGDSGFGKEGPKWAVAEMTEEKMVVLHPRS